MIIVNGIDFRVWDKDLSNMEEVHLIDFVRNEVKTIGNPPCDTSYFKVMQYTGLDDGKGTKIYEGDILKDVDGIIGIVEIEEGNTYWNWLNISTLLSESHDVLEVIGNFYQSPELLEG